MFFHRGLEMINTVKFFLLAVIMLMPCTLLANSGMVFLEANFDDKPIDEPIGTGGPVFGEPVSVGWAIKAVVRDAPMTTPCLEIKDNDNYSAGAARFEFRESLEITHGLVIISATLRFETLGPGHSFFIYVREQGSSAQSFTNIRFQSTGDVRVDDENGSAGVIGTYPVGRSYPVSIAFDMDSGTYDIYLDGVLTLVNKAHGISSRGVGAALFGCSHDPDVEGTFYVDDIFVTNDHSTVETQSATWEKVKSLYR